MVTKSEKRLARWWYRSVRLGFRLLYNELAWSYDAVSWIVSLGQWRQWQEAILPFLSGADVLEIAHGPGHLLQRLKNASFEVVGLDVSPSMGKIAQKRLRQANIIVPLVRARAQDSPFASDAFDVVVSTFPAEFIVEQTTIKNIFRILRPGGKLLIVPEARLTGGGPLLPIIEWLYAITGQRQGPARGYGPSSLWAATSRRFAECGFQLHLEEVELARSIVTIVVAEKPAGG